ncbi:hypothetical protein Q8A73_010819 [Channa argus]|nr:hypothetical protein Q8A73_010819 [Channa argus]
MGHQWKLGPPLGVLTPISKPHQESINTSGRGQRCALISHGVRLGNRLGVSRGVRPGSPPSELPRCTHPSTAPPPPSSFPLLLCSSLAFLPSGSNVHVWVCIFFCVCNRSHSSAWGKTGGAGGMRLVPPLYPEGPEGPAKQGAGVAPSARHQSTMAGGSWSSVPPSPPPMHEHPAGRQQEGLWEKHCVHTEQWSNDSAGMKIVLMESLMGDPIALFSSNNPTEHVNMKHYLPMLGQLRRAAEIDNGEETRNKNAAPGYRAAA